MNRTAHLSAFTMAEMLIAMAGSSIIVGALLFSAMSLQRSLQAAESFAENQASQRRLLDYVARDLRRAIGIACADTVNGAGATRVSGTSVLVEGTTSLLLTVPGYYQSQAPTDPTYSMPFPVVAADNYVDYGTATAHAPGVSIAIRRQYIAEEKSICFLRLEGGNQDIIVRHAENLHLTVTLDPDGRTGNVETNFVSPKAGLGTLTTEREAILLRNVRLD